VCLPLSISSIRSPSSSSSSSLSSAFSKKLNVSRTSPGFLVKQVENYLEQFIPVDDWIIHIHGTGLDDASNAIQSRRFWAQRQNVQNQSEICYLGSRQEKWTTLCQLDKTNSFRPSLKSVAVCMIRWGLPTYLFISCPFRLAGDSPPLRIWSRFLFSTEPFCSEPDRPSNERTLWDRTSSIVSV
jgi:hypothetical protein